MMTITNKAKKGGISIFALAMLNIVAVVSLRGLPAEAEYGLSSIFYYIFAAVVFLVPVSLVAAELATGWSEKGGVFRWVGEAFGATISISGYFHVMDRSYRLVPNCTNFWFSFTRIYGSSSIMGSSIITK